jgi:hypothetical protein
LLRRELLLLRLLLLLLLLRLLLLLLRLRGLRRRRWHGRGVGGEGGGLCGVRAFGGVEGLVVRARADRDGVGCGVGGRGELADAQALAVALRAAVEDGAVLARSRTVRGNEACCGAGVARGSGGCWWRWWERR